MSKAIRHQPVQPGPAIRRSLTGCWLTGLACCVFGLKTAPAHADTTVWTLPAPAGQQLQLSISGSSVTKAQQAELSAWLQSQWDLLSDDRYWPLAQQFASTQQWPADAALLQQALQQCEAWWQQQRSYHCRFGAARQQWQALLPVSSQSASTRSTATTRALANTTAVPAPAQQPEQVKPDRISPNRVAPDRVQLRQQARQLLKQQSGFVPDLQQFGRAVLLDQLLARSAALWPAASQIHLQLDDWQAVRGQAAAVRALPGFKAAGQSTSDQKAASQSAAPLTQLQLKDAVLVSANTTPAQATAAGRYSPVWLPAEAWPVQYGPAVAVVSQSFSRGWLLAQALTSASAAQRQQWLQAPDAALFARHPALLHKATPPSITQPSTTRPSATEPPATDLQASAGWYGWLQDAGAYQQANALQLELELPDFGAGSKRPYVSIWLTAAKQAGQPTHTWQATHAWQAQLLLLGEQPRWYQELRSWWRQLPGRQDQPALDQWAGATRRAGQHQFHWDGRLADGRPLPAGDYQLWVEAAREGGGREQLKLALHWPLDSQSELALQGHSELGQVRLRLAAAN